MDMRPLCWWLLTVSQCSAMSMISPGMSRLYPYLFGPSLVTVMTCRGATGSRTTDLKLNDEQKCPQLGVLAMVLAIGTHPAQPVVRESIVSLPPPSHTWCPSVGWEQGLGPQAHEALYRSSSSGRGCPHQLEKPSHAVHDMTFRKATGTAAAHLLLLLRVYPLVFLVAVKEQAEVGGGMPNRNERGLAFPTSSRRQGDPPNFRRDGPGVLYVLPPERSPRRLRCGHGICMEASSRLAEDWRGSRRCGERARTCSLRRT